LNAVAVFAPSYGPFIIDPSAASPTIYVDPTFGLIITDPATALPTSFLPFSGVGLGGAGC